MGHDREMGDDRALFAERFRLLAGVAEKAIAIGRHAEAERLIASAVADYSEAARRGVRSLEEWETLVALHDALAPICEALESATGKPWKRNLPSPGGIHMWTMRKLPGRA